jgi:SAM-dependent methyltransferase
MSTVRELDRGSSTATPLNVRYRVDRVAPHLQGHWLDFGCADGGYDAELLRRGADRITGVDVEEARVEAARGRGVAGTSYHHFDGATLPFADCSFDGVFMNEVFEHVADEGRVLAETFRVLRPGGTLILISPNRWFPVDGHFVTIAGRDIGPAPLLPWLPRRLTRHIASARNYWPHELRDQVRDAGFVVADLEFIWPVLEVIPFLPPQGVAWYQRNFRRWDRTPGIRRFGLSTMVIGVRPVQAGR